jgi:excisionase family DNA binding protein
MTVSPRTPAANASLDALATLPPVEVVDTLPKAALPGFLAGLAALQARAAVRMQSTPDPDKGALLSLDEAADRLRVSRKRLLDLTREPGGLPRVEVSRKELLIRRADLDAWVAGRVVEAPTILYSSLHHDRRRTSQDSEAARRDASAARGATRRPLEQRGAVGAGRGRHLRARSEASSHPGKTEAGETPPLSGKEENV